MVFVSGLWTQAALTPDACEQDSRYQRVPDIYVISRKEVSVGGVSALKTDVAWVGSRLFNGTKVQLKMDTIS